jgi:catechol 2,3-dioxygenase-like lactoylglutathione lyase family enzyme
MTLRPTVFEIFVSDMAASLAFCRRLGLSIPPDVDDQPHVDIELDNGLRLTWDTEETMRSFDPGWSAPPGGGSRAGLAFACDSPAEVDATYADMTGAGYKGHLAPFDAFWGMRYAVLHDPDGVTVDLFAQLPQ